MQVKERAAGTTVVREFDIHDMTMRDYLQFGIAGLLLVNLAWMGVTQADQSGKIASLKSAMDANSSAVSSLNQEFTKFEQDQANAAARQAQQAATPMPTAIPLGTTGSSNSLNSNLTGSGIGGSGTTGTGISGNGLGDTTSGTNGMNGSSGLHDSGLPGSSATAAPSTTSTTR